MRRLQTHDVFKAMKIINAAGIKEEVKKMSALVEKKKITDIREAGIDFILSLLGNCSDEKAERLIYEFLGGLIEMDPDEIGTMDALEFAEKVKELSTVIDLDGWKAFFKSLSAMIR